MASVPGPICVRPPLPLTGTPKTAESERLKASRLLSTTALVLLIEPVVPPLPICRVPALIVVRPL